jgi:hypothetical protein
MKTTITILAAVLTLNAGILFAGATTFSGTETIESSIVTLAPATPIEATFEDANIAVIDFSAIIPSTPAEADFSDVAPEAGIDLTNLVPVTPAVADFNDAIEVTIDINALAPVTPSVDFE